MLMLYPLVFALVLYLVLRAEYRDQAAWRDHPDRPWNVQDRASRKAAEWHRQELARRHARQGGQRVR